MYKQTKYIALAIFATATIMFIGAGGSAYAQGLEPNVTTTPEPPEPVPGGNDVSNKLYLKISDKDMVVIDIPYKSGNTYKIEPVK